MAGRTPVSSQQYELRWSPACAVSAEPCSSREASPHLDQPPPPAAGGPPDEQLVHIIFSLLAQQAACSLQGKASDPDDPVSFRRSREQYYRPDAETPSRELASTNLLPSCRRKV